MDVCSIEKARDCIYPVSHVKRGLDKVVRQITPKNLRA